MAFSLAAGLVSELLGDLKHTVLVSAPGYPRRSIRSAEGSARFPVACLFLFARTPGVQK